MPETSLSEEFLLEPLSWDSDHFGIPVARLRGSSGDVSVLGRALEAARAQGIRLAYWAAEPGQIVPDSLLLEFSGLCVDHKATFATPLDEAASKGVSTTHFDTLEFPRGLPSPRLLQLALAAGAYSRFRSDPRIPPDAYRRLYEVWITRSTLGELADWVLVASRPDDACDPLGMITLSMIETAGSIGLLAVAEEARGRGVGSLLLDAAHRLLARNGARSVSVVTQLDNRPACRLYEKCGYRLVDLERIYHFWLQERS